MATKIKKKSPNRSPHPDNSTERKIWEHGYRKGCEDMDEAKRDIMYYGFAMHQLLTLYILCDKYKGSDEELQQLLNDMLDYENMVNGGFLSYQQMQDSLMDVHHLKFTWQDDLKWEANKITDKRYRKEKP